MANQLQIFTARVFFSFPSLLGAERVDGRVVVSVDVRVVRQAGAVRLQPGRRVSFTMASRIRFLMNECLCCRRRRRHHHHHHHHHHCRSSSSSNNEDDDDNNNNDNNNINDNGDDNKSSSSVIVMKNPPTSCVEIINVAIFWLVSCKTKLPQLENLLNYKV